MLFFSPLQLCTRVIEKNANPEWNQMLNLQAKVRGETHLITHKIVHEYQILWWFFWSNFLFSIVPLHVWACKIDSLWLVSQAWPLWWKVIFVTRCISDCSTSPLRDKLCVFSCCIASLVSQNMAASGWAGPSLPQQHFPRSCLHSPKTKAHCSSVFSEQNSDPGMLRGN